MKIKDILEIIEKIAPKETALDYDNVGIMVGSDESELSGILLTVDVTAAAVVKAVENNCNLIIAHHPLIFIPKTSFTVDDYQSALIAECFVKGICVYAAHTNVDCMQGNMSFDLLNKLGAKNLKALEECGAGAVGDINKKKLGALADEISKILDDNRVFTVGDDNAEISRISMINGGGADAEALQAARKENATVFISADIKHHIMLEAKEIGLNLISVGHYSSEKCFNDILFDIIDCHNDTHNTVKHFEGNPFN